jgi:hypothetical protein
MESGLDATTQVLKLDLGVPPRVLLVDDDDLLLGRLEGLLVAADSLFALPLMARMR